MRHIPWKKISSWRCLGCGKCCERFRVNLRSYEYAKIINYRADAVELDEFGNPYLKKIGDRCIFQNQYNLCDLQFLDMKPFFCKIWPFIVLNRPESNTRQNAEFYYKDKEYYVYINPYATMCPGINRGVPEDLPLTIAEVIEICQNPEKRQKYSTSNLQNRSRKPMGVSIMQPSITIKRK